MNNETQHSVTMALLLLAMGQVANCIKEHESNLAPGDKENLLASLGSLTCQAEMLGYVEEIPDRNELQNGLLERLRRDSGRMIDLVKQSLFSFTPATQGANHG